MLNIGSVLINTTTRIVRILEPNNEVLRTQLNQYTPISGDYYTVPLYETEETPIALGHTKLVRESISCCNYFELT
jgi:hypothetical protein